MMTTISGWATPEGTRTYRERFIEAAPGHFREPYGLSVSSIGIGTYLGTADDTTDRHYINAVTQAVEHGINVVDSAINYRFQRSERSIGKALVRLKKKGIDRNEVVIATKAGFLSFDGTAPADPGEYIVRTYVDTGLLTMDDIAAGSHSIAPRYLDTQLNRSLENLGIGTIDIFYLHNPETQLEEVDRDVFAARMRAAFEVLESAVSDGRIRGYGAATWNAFRAGPQARGFVNLAEIVHLAREVGGDDHHFKFVQMPYNLSMREAHAARNQRIEGLTRSPLEAAADLGLTVMASASMLQSRLTRNLPASFSQYLPGADTDGLRALQFVRSTPGVTTALVGMSQKIHVEENLRLVRIPPASPDAVQAMFNAS
jgi:aryl-alcohol dehydrogenase-like predicted oxidoreductase